MKFRSKKFLSAVTMALVLIVNVLVVPFSSQAAALGPKEGKVLSTETMTLPAELQSLASGKRIKYLSTDVNGQYVVVSGAIITPNNQPLHPDTVAWAHGTTGFGDNCAPSSNLDVFWPEAVAAVKSYLEHGWTVAATDFPGLGTSGNQHYFIGDSEARAVIDSVRAARNLDWRLSNKWAVAGHSQGGQAALFAGEIADTYGGGLQLKGVVAMAPVSNEDIIGPAVVGTPIQGYLVMAIYGLAAVDSSVDPSAILAQPALDRAGVLETGCLDEVLSAYAPLNPQRLLVGGQLPDYVIEKLAHYGNPAQQASTVPMLLVQGTADESVPADLTAYLHSQICTYNTPAYLQFIEGAGHDTAVIQSTDLVASYITDRFNNLPAPDNCQ